MRYNPYYLAAFKYGLPLAARYLGGKTRSKYRRNLPYKRRIARARSTRFKRQRRYRRQTRYATSSRRGVQRIKKQVQTLQKRQANSLGTLTYRQLAAKSATCEPAFQNTIWSPANRTVPDMENAMQHARMFNPNDPANLITVNLAAGSYARNVRFASITQHVSYTNNYQFPLELDVYLCNVKDDTSLSPAQAWEEAIGDQSNNIGQTFLGHYPTDYNLVNDLWKLKVIKKVVLKPGEMIKIKHSVKDVNYDPATRDSQQLTYQKEYKAFGFFAIFRGCIGHLDQEYNNEIPATRGKCGLDTYTEKIYKLEYEAGGNIEWKYVDNNLIREQDIPGQQPFNVVHGNYLTNNFTYSAA